jgi:hypothetical protein
MFRTAAASAALLVLAGCTTSTDPAPTVTVTAQAEPAPAPAADPVTSAALEVAWDSMDDEAHDAMCLLFTVDEQWAWEEFSAGSGEDFITREQFADFFDGKC